MYILSKMFQTVKQSCFVGSPPTKEMIDAFIKVGNKSSDAILKVQGYKALTRVIKAAPQNLSSYIPEIMKNHFKYVEREDVDIKIQCVKGMQILVKKSFSYTILHDYYE